MQARKAGEQHEECTDAAPRPIVFGPVDPVLVGCRLVGSVAGAQEPADEQKDRESDARQREHALQGSRDGVGR